MAMTDTEITGRIAQLYPDASIEVAGEDCSFEVFVVSDAFAKLNTLQRQQPILKLFADELASGKLHALSITARTSQELVANSGLLQIQG